jgi:hypothetical protein
VSVPFEKFVVEFCGKNGHFKVRLLNKTGDKPIERINHEKKAELEDERQRKFIESAIKEKLQRERETPHE